MNEDHEAVEELVLSPVTIMGLADAGAHATQIMDASQPTYFIAHWARDEQVISLEEAVHKMTGAAAKRFRLDGRGRLEEGYAADITRTWAGDHVHPVFRALLTAALDHKIVVDDELKGLLPLLNLNQASGQGGE